MDEPSLLTVSLDHGKALGVVALLLEFPPWFQGLEVAFFSLSPQALHDLEQEDNPASRRVLRLFQTLDNTEGPRNLLGTILVVNNLVNVAIVLIATVLAESMFPSESLPAWLNTAIHGGRHPGLVLFGEVIPKVYATTGHLANGGCPCQALCTVSTCLVALGSHGRWLDGRLRTPQLLVWEDLETALELTDNAERTQEEQRILEGIVNFGSKDAKQVMTPRTDVLTFAMTDAWPHVRVTIVASGFSRIPIHEGSADQIVGVSRQGPHFITKTTCWARVYRPMFVPESKKIDDLPRNFRNERCIWRSLSTNTARVASSPWKTCWKKS